MSESEIIESRTLDVIRNVPEEEGQEALVTPEMQSGLSVEIQALHDRVSGMDARIGARASELGIQEDGIANAKNSVGYEKRTSALKERFRRLAAAFAASTAITFPAFAGDTPDVADASEPIRIAMLQPSMESMRNLDIPNGPLENIPQSSPSKYGVSDSQEIKSLPGAESLSDRPHYSGSELKKLNFERLGIDQETFDALQKLINAVVLNGTMSTETYSALGNLMEIKKGSVISSVAEQVVPFYSGGKKIKEALAGEANGKKLEGATRVWQFLKGLGSAVLDYGTLGGGTALRNLAGARKVVNVADTGELLVQYAPALNYIHEHPEDMDGIVEKLGDLVEQKTVVEKIGDEIERAATGSIQSKG